MKRPRRYAEPQTNEWVQPVRRGYKLACCDCGLVHAVDFRIVRSGRGRFIQFRVRRHDRATAGMRGGSRYAGLRHYLPSVTRPFPLAPVKRSRKRQQGGKR